MARKVNNILLIGQNYASVMNSLALGLKEKGLNVRATSFELSRSKYNNYSQFYFKLKAEKYNLITYWFTMLQCTFMLVRLLCWADTVHVYYIPRLWKYRKLDLWLINLLSRNKIVTFMGSEIRQPEITIERNLYFKQAFENPGYEYKGENAIDSYKLQRLYSRCNFKAIVWDTEEYLFKELFPRIFIVPHASANTLKTVVSSNINSNLLVVHSPSAPIAKGTPLIIAAMEKVCSAFPDVEFKLLHNISNEKYQETLCKADVLIDQVVWGAYGVATQQALQMGKIVMAYLNPYRASLYGECPVINITIETIEQEIKKLLVDPLKKVSIAKQSVQYYQKVHSPIAVAEKVLTVYKAS